jgi:peptide/nickel transport system substrate-binding protein/microcin C transport system substrate-binding protein
MFVNFFEKMMKRQQVIVALGLVLFASFAFGAAAALKPFGNPNAPQTGTFAINLKGEPTTLNPITSTDGYAQDVQSYILDSLMERNVDTYDWIPALAESVDKSKDGHTFTFKIRQGVKWTDGQPMTAEDVKFSFDVIFDPVYNAAAQRPYYENIEKCEIIAPDQVRFTTKNKYFGNFDVVAGLTILPKHIYGKPEEGKKINKTLIGTGPYKIEKYDQGQSIVLVKNKDWWGNAVDWRKGMYNFERIRIRFINDDNIAVESLEKGDVDYVTMNPEMFMKKTEGPTWGKTSIKEKVENLAPKGFNYIGWNMRKDLFKDKNVRLALYYLMNRDEMNKKFRYGMSIPATGPWYQQSDYADKSVKPIPYDPKKALELLKAAGWSDSDKDGVLDKMIGGKKVDFKFDLIYGNKDSEKYYVLYQSDLKKVGIQMNLQLLEFNALLKNLDDGGFDAASLSWGGGSVDLDPKQIWSSASIGPSGSNFVAYSNPEVDKLIEDARAELDKAKRIKMLRVVYKRIAEDVPYAFMFNDKYDLYAHTSKMGMTKPTYKYSQGTGFWWLKQ